APACDAGRAAGPRVSVVRCGRRRVPAARPRDRQPGCRPVPARADPTMTRSSGGMMAVDLSRRAFRAQRWAARAALAAATSAVLVPLIDGGLTGLLLLVCGRSEEHTSELQSRENLVCRLLLEE